MSGARLRDRHALVTGAGRGIGRAIALAFAAEGVAVAAAARTQVEIDSIAEECRNIGAESFAVPVDVADEASCVEVVERCRAAWGGIDILVHSAGVAMSHKFTEIETSAWNRTLAVDLTGPFFLTRAALPGMLARGNGNVIFIASIAGKQGAPYIAPYVAAKHGLIGLMRALAAEYPSSGVTFNCVCPAYVDTPLTESAITTIQKKTGRSRADALQALFTPQGRLIRPEEVAAVCVLLVSPEGQAINGQAINVDGGAVQS